MISRDEVGIVPTRKRGLNGQLAMPAIDQHEQLHTARASVVKQRIERGANGAARVQHVVHQDDVASVDVETDVALVHRRARPIGRSGRRDRRRYRARRSRSVIFSMLPISTARRSASGTPRRLMPDQSRRCCAPSFLLDDFMRQPHQRPFDFGRRHQPAFGSKLRRFPARSAPSHARPLFPHSIPTLLSESDHSSRPGLSVPLTPPAARHAGDRAACPEKRAAGRIASSKHQPARDASR